MDASVSKRCTLVQAFVEFELLPDLLALAPGRALSPEPGGGKDVSPFVAPDVIPTLEKWANMLAETGAYMDHVVDGDLPAGVAEEVVLAQDAWDLGERLHLLWPEGRTVTGNRLARLARRAWDDRTKADHRTVVRTVAAGVREHYVGADGLEVVPLLQDAARTLADTDHVWAKHCPGLLLVEFEALIYWAFEDRDRALRLRDDLVIHRDVAMHRYGVPPPGDADPDDIEIVHEDETTRLYLETEEWRRERI